MKKLIFLCVISLMSTALAAPTPPKSEEEVEFDKAMPNLDEMVEAPSLDTFTKPPGYSLDKDGFEVENEKLHRKVHGEPKRKPASVGKPIVLPKGALKALPKDLEEKNLEEKMPLDDQPQGQPQE